ncbi:MAG: alpha-amylase, partial [Chloroflexia bacterium]|nr:alpha-amylase [Chloroflexia bacterium]
MTHWSHDAIFYHIYPLGLCGAPHTNPFDGSIQPRLRELHAWIEPMRTLGVKALYLGPLFEATSHGYDTADYYTLDRRLGTNAMLAELANELHRNGIRLILDGVFHHVGRDFWAFRDLLTHQEASAYRDWFEGIDFSQRSPYGDPFSYASWEGHYNLV